MIITEIEQKSTIQHNLRIKSDKLERFALVEIVESITDGDFSSLHRLKEAIREEHLDPIDFFHDKAFLDGIDDPFHRMRATLVRLNYLTACVNENFANQRIRSLLEFIQSLFLLNVYHTIADVKTEVIYSELYEKVHSLKGFIVQLEDSQPCALLVQKDPFKMVSRGMSLLRDLEPNESLEAFLNVFGIDLNTIIANKSSYRKWLQDLLVHFPVGQRLNPEFSLLNDRINLMIVSHNSMKWSFPDCCLTLKRHVSIVVSDSPKKLIVIFQKYIFKLANHWTNRDIYRLTNIVDTFLGYPQNHSYEFQEVHYFLSLLTLPWKTREENAVLQFRTTLLAKLVKAKLPSEASITDLVHVVSARYLFSQEEVYKFFYREFKELNPQLSKLLNDSLEAYINNLIWRFANEDPRTLLQKITPTIDLCYQVNPRIASRAIKLLLEYVDIASLPELIMRSGEKCTKSQLVKLLSNRFLYNINRNKEDLLGSLTILELIIKNSVTYEEIKEYLELFRGFIPELNHNMVRQKDKRLQNKVQNIFKYISPHVKPYEDLYLHFFEICFSLLSPNTFIIKTFEFIRKLEKIYSNDKQERCKQIREHFGKGNLTKGLQFLNKNRMPIPQLGEIGGPSFMEVFSEFVDDLRDEDLISYESLFVSSIRGYIEMLSMMFDLFYATNSRTLSYLRLSLVDSYFQLCGPNLSREINEKIKQLEEKDILYQQYMSDSLQNSTTNNSRKTEEKRETKEDLRKKLKDKKKQLAHMR